MMVTSGQLWVNTTSRLITLVVGYPSLSSDMAGWEIPALKMEAYSWENHRTKWSDSPVSCAWLPEGMTWHKSGIKALLGILIYFNILQYHWIITPFRIIDTLQKMRDTVDGRNAAPVDRLIIPLFIGFQPSFWWRRISQPSTVAPCRCCLGFQRLQGPDLRDHWWKQSPIDLMLGCGKTWENHWVHSISIHMLAPSFSPSPTDHNSSLASQMARDWAIRSKTWKSTGIILPLFITIQLMNTPELCETKTPTMCRDWLYPFPFYSSFGGVFW